MLSVLAELVRNRRVGDIYSAKQNKHAVMFKQEPGNPILWPFPIN